MTSRLLELIQTTLEDSKASEIIVLDVQQMTSITDTIVICSGRSNRHVRAIANRLTEQLKNKSIIPIGTTGLETATWVLIDLADVLVNIMVPETRSHYDLEKLWQYPDIKPDAV